MTEAGDNQIVDEDGVLALIQKLEYDGHNSTFIATFFNGRKKVFLSEMVTSEVIFDLETNRITQNEEIRFNIEALALANWRRWMQ